MERLTKVMSCPDGTKIYDISNKLLGLNTSRADKTRMILEKLAIYEDLEEQGRLISLPCKVCDTVYVIVGKNISVQKIQRVTIDSERKIEFCTKKRGFTLFDIGKTIFLTKSEAYEKLKELRGEENE